MLSSGEPCPCPPGCCHIIGTATVFRRSFHVSIRPATSGGGEHGKTSGLHDHSPTVTLLGMKIYSLFRNSIVWNTTPVDQAFFKTMYGGLGRSIMYKKGKYITRISIYTTKDKMLSFPWRTWFNVVNLPPGHCLVTPGNGAISEAQCWFLLLVDLVLSSNCNQVSLGEWKSMLLSPCIVPYLPL